MNGEWERRLVLFWFRFRTQLLPRARDGKSLFVEELLDSKNRFNVLLAIHALPGAALDRLQLREFRFPEPQHIGRQPAKIGNFADTKIKLVGNNDFIPVRFGLQLGTHSIHPSRRLERRTASAFLARSAFANNYYLA